MNSIFDIKGLTGNIVAVFTTHDEWSDYLVFNKNNTGHTGDWLIGKNREPELVVLYHRVENENHIYMAQITHIEGPLPKYDGVNRCRLHFKNYQHMGTTNSKWSEFAACGANPVRYLSV